MVEKLEARLRDILVFHLPPNTGPGGEAYFKKAGLLSGEKYGVVGYSEGEETTILKVVHLTEKDIPLFLKKTKKEDSFPLIEVNINFFERYSK
jgi:hypothetical protein